MNTAVRGNSSKSNSKARLIFGALSSALAFTALILTACSGDNGTNPTTEQGKTVPSSVIPDTIRAQLAKAMPLHSGDSPPNISGQYVMDSVVLAGSSSKDDTVGSIRGTNRYIYFAKQGTGSKYAFRVKNGDYVSDDITADVIGNGDNFTAYFTETTYEQDIRVKVSTVFSGTMSKDGIKNIHYAIIYLSKGSDPKELVDPVNSFRVYKSGSGIAGTSKWLTVTITVTLNINGGSGSASPITLNDGDSIALPEWDGYKKSGYIFDGWNTASDGSGTSYGAGSYYTPVAGVDITLYARWISDKENVPSSAIPDGVRGKFAMSMPLNSGGTPPDIYGQYIIDNIKLAGSSDSNDVVGGGVDDDLYIAISDGGNGKFKVNYKQGDHEYESKDVEVVGDGDDFTLYFKETGTEKGITYEKSIIFTGTKTGSGGIRDLHYGTILTKKGSDPQNLLGPVNTYRVYRDGDGTSGIREWIKIEIIITININGGDGKALELKPDADGYVTLPGGDGYTRRGYVFIGWNTKADGTGTDYKPGSKWKPTVGVTIYIRWVAESEYVPATVLPNAIREQFEDLMPLHYGGTPPDISGQYMANNFTLTGSSISGDDIGEKFAAMYVAFIKSGSKLSYRERQDGDDFGGDDVTVQIVGSGGGFTAFFTATGSVGTTSITQATLISGNLETGGIRDFYYAYVVLEKGNDPQNQLVPVNTFRIFKDGDGLAEKHNWYEGVTPQPTSYTITFNADGGRVNGQTTTTATTGANGKLATMPNDAVWADHTFLGWFINDGHDKVTTSTVFTGNTTAWARWTEAPVQPSGSLVLPDGQAWVIDNGYCGNGGDCWGYVFQAAGSFQFLDDGGGTGAWTVYQSGAYSTNGSSVTIGNSTYTYSVSGNTLTLTRNGYSETYTKKSVTIGGTGGEFEFYLIPAGQPNENTYRVSKGTVTTGAVVIPATYNGKAVTEIGSFYPSTITSITIPAGVKGIIGESFYNVSTLTSVSLPATLTLIDNNSFAYCTGLTNVIIPASVTTIGPNAFRGCTGITTITVPASVTTVNVYAFAAWNNKQTINVPFAQGNKPAGWNGEWNRDCGATINYAASTPSGSLVNAAGEAWVRCNESGTNCEGIVFKSNGGFQIVWGDHGDWGIDAGQAGTWSVSGNILTMTYTVGEYEGDVDEIDYRVSGNTLTLSGDGVTLVWTKTSGLNISGLGKSRVLKKSAKVILER